MGEAISKALIEDRAHAFMGQGSKSVVRLVSYMFYQYRNKPKHSLIKANLRPKNSCLCLIRPNVSFNECLGLFLYW